MVQANLLSPEILVPAVLILVLFGGAKIPELARGLGQGLKEFKQATKDDPTPTPEKKDEEKKDA